MESHGTRLTPGVTRHFTQCDKTRHTGHRDYMSVIILDHVGQEFLDGPEMRERVHLVGQADGLFRDIDDGSIGAGSGIVDEDCWGAVGFADFRSRLFEDLGRCDVCFVEVGVWGFSFLSIHTNCLYTERNTHATQSRVPEYLE